MIDVVGHAGGFSWDEALLFAAPVVVLVILQMVGRRRARAEEANGQDDAGEEEGA